MRVRMDAKEAKEARQPYLVTLDKPVPGYGEDAAERLRLERKYLSRMRTALNNAALVSFQGNKVVPLLRLYRFKEAFSLRLVEEFIKRFRLSSADYIFDPFAGMGTTLFGAMKQGIPSVGIDVLPIARFVAETIPMFLLLDASILGSVYLGLRRRVDSAPLAPVALDVPLMRVAFSEENILRLRQWKTVIDELATPLKEVFLLLFFSVLSETSYTSNDGQFLRLRPDKKTSAPDLALQTKVEAAQQDVVSIKRGNPAWGEWMLNLPQVYSADTRNLSGLPFVKPPTAIITSPPYPNRYDYTRSYCLELCFHFVRNFEELKRIRFGVLRSHIESKLSPQERPSHPAVLEAIAALRLKELNNPRIPHLIAAYFIDMEAAIREWSKVLAPGAKVAMVVDNVRFEGELIPVDLILSEMAESVGFDIDEIIIARYKGNSSQQMGKFGRVPVRESIVVWRKL